MTTLSYDYVYALGRSVGLTAHEATIATAIAAAESGLNPKNLGDATLSKYGSRGLWQVFTKVHSPAEVVPGSSASSWTPELIAKLEDPKINAHAMWLISGHGANWHPWSTFNDGAYSHHLAAAQTAAAKVGEHWYAELHASSAPPPVAHPKRAAARAWMKQESAHPTRNRKNECLRTVRIALGIPSGADWAIHAWDAADPAYSHTAKIPEAGTPYFFKGAGKYGHIVLVDTPGKTVDDTTVWSTDIKRSGKVDLVTIGYIKKKWAMRGLGWTTRLNGVDL